MKPAESFQSGDILSVDRVFYRHYGIYAGKGRVIHYTAGNGDFGADAGIRETDLEQFARGGKCKIASFSGSLNKPKPYSRKETVRRALSRIGEKRYNLFFNNCENFAMWCKYGESKSVQVEKAFAAAIVLGTVVVAAHLTGLNEEG